MVYYIPYTIYGTIGTVPTIVGSNYTWLIREYRIHLKN
jgi:hypothetical protein